MEAVVYVRLLPVCTGMKEIVFDICCMSDAAVQRDHNAQLTIIAIPVTQQGIFLSVGDP